MSDVTKVASTSNEQLKTQLAELKREGTALQASCNRRDAAYKGTAVTLGGVAVVAGAVYAPAVAAGAALVGMATTLTGCPKAPTTPTGEGEGEVEVPSNLQENEVLVPRFGQKAAEQIKVTYTEVALNNEYEVITNLEAVSVQPPVPLAIGYTDTSFQNVKPLKTGAIWGNLKKEDFQDEDQGYVSFGTYGQDNLPIDKADVNGMEYAVMNKGVSTIYVGHRIDNDGMVFTRGKDKLVLPAESDPKYADIKAMMTLQDDYLMTTSTDPTMADDIRYFIPTDRSTLITLKENETAEIYDWILRDAFNGRVADAGAPVIQDIRQAAVTTYVTADPNNTNVYNGVTLPPYAALGSLTGDEPYSIATPPILNGSIDYATRVDQLQSNTAIPETVTGFSAIPDLPAGTTIPTTPGLYSNRLNREVSYTNMNNGAIIIPGDSEQGLKWYSGSGLAFEKAVILHWNADFNAPAYGTPMHPDAQNPGIPIQHGITMVVSEIVK